MYNIYSISFVNATKYTVHLEKIGSFFNERLDNCSDTEAT